MKRLMFHIILTIFIINGLYAQDYFYLKEDIKKGKNGELIVDENRKLTFGEKFGFYISNKFDDKGYYYYKFEEYLYLMNIKQEEEKYLTSDILLFNYNNKINCSFFDYVWLPEYYYKQLISNDRFNLILNNEKYWKDFDPLYFKDAPDMMDVFNVKTLNFRDYYFFFSGNGWKFEVTCFAKLIKQESNVLLYEIQKIFDGDENYKFIEKPSVFSDINLLQFLYKDLPYKVYFVFDGDYVNMYLHEISDENLFQTFIRTTPENCTTIEKWIKNKTDDLSNIIWPHHADGTSEYEDTIRYPEPIVIEEPEEIEIEEYKEPEKKEIPPFPDEKDPNYLEIIKEYYPNIYEDQLKHFEYLNTMKKIKILVISITSVIIMLLLLFIIIKNKRKSNKL